MMDNDVGDHTCKLSSNPQLLGFIEKTVVLTIYFPLWKATRQIFGKLVSEGFFICVEGKQIRVLLKEHLDAVIESRSDSLLTFT